MPLRKQQGAGKKEAHSKPQYANKRNKPPISGPVELSPLQQLKHSGQYRPPLPASSTQISEPIFHGSTLYGKDDPSDGEKRSLEPQRSRASLAASESSSSITHPYQTQPFTSKNASRASLANPSRSSTSSKYSQEARRDVPPHNDYYASIEDYAHNPLMEHPDNTSMGQVATTASGGHPIHGRPLNLGSHVSPYGQGGGFESPRTPPIPPGAGKQRNESNIPGRKIPSVLYKPWTASPGTLTRAATQKPAQNEIPIPPNDGKTTPAPGQSGPIGSSAQMSSDPGEVNSMMSGTSGWYPKGPRRRLHKEPKKRK